MTTRQQPDVLIARDELVASPAERACNDQTFELPGGIYAAMALLFAGFVAVLGTAFRGGHMAVVYGVIFAFLAAFFAIPVIFSRPPGEGHTKALSWTMFQYKGDRHSDWPHERHRGDGAGSHAAVPRALLCDFGSDYRCSGVSVSVSARPSPWL